MEIYGGERDYQAPAPLKLEPHMFVTTEINNLFMSLDHNSLLYNRHFLNVFIPMLKDSSYLAFKGHSNGWILHLAKQNNLDLMALTKIVDIGCEEEMLNGPNLVMIPPNEKYETHYEGRTPYWHFKFRPGVYFLEIPEAFDPHVFTMCQPFGLEHTDIPIARARRDSSFLIIDSLGTPVSSMMRLDNDKKWTKNLANFQQSIKHQGTYRQYDVKTPKDPKTFIVQPLPTQAQ
jgi:hypothetical protein